MKLKTWKLKRTRQCDKCPWRKDVDAREIPDGYCIRKHQDLKCTIADNRVPVAQLKRNSLPVMTCHETRDAHCVGWLANQLGPGNNLVMRIKMMDCENADNIELVGEQHEHFNDTMPGDRQGDRAEDGKTVFCSANVGTKNL